MALFRAGSLPLVIGEAHRQILETVLVSCIRINLHKSLTQEIRCLLTHENQSISPRVEMFEEFISSGDMSHTIYTKLYNSMVEPVLEYGSGIWGTKSYTVINSVQNKACTYF
jgi:hypothetical protein